MVEREPELDLGLAAGAGESDLPGPFAVGKWATGFQGFLRGRPRVQLIGEVAGYREGRGANCYFELRDSDGAVPCAMWRREFDRLDLPEGSFRDGIQVIAEGGPDFYPGSGQSSPSFAFRVDRLRLAGEGDLMARLAELRRLLGREGLFEPQKKLPRAVMPRRIGVVTSPTGAARADLLAGLERRGWRGTIVWAHTPVQDRRAAPRIIRAIQDLAAVAEVDAIVVCRGGGSLADLWAFCDETLCRTVAMLSVPVIAAVGHETDRTLIDDVAAVSCSTPTHAAEAVVPVELGAERERLARIAARMGVRSRDAVRTRASHLRGLAAVPGRHLDEQRRRLHQRVREVRRASERRLGERRTRVGRGALVVSRKAAAAGPGQRAESVRLGRQAAALARSEAQLAARADRLRTVSLALRAHDPDQVVARGFAIASDGAGRPVTTAGAAIAAGDVRLRFKDGRVNAKVEAADDER